MPGIADINDKAAAAAEVAGGVCDASTVRFPSGPEGLHLSGGWLKVHSLPNLQSPVLVQYWHTGLFGRMGYVPLTMPVGGMAAFSGG